MTLSKKEINGLMRLIGLTKDDEINCEQCLWLVAEFTEQQLAGRSIPEGLKAVEHHLAICAECREEYEALQRALQNMEGCPQLIKNPPLGERVVGRTEFVQK